jgi:hypothetical protein
VAKVDYKKTFKELYAPPDSEVVRVVVPSLMYLMIDGEGDPNTSPAYPQAVECLFGLAYAIKFAVKRGPLAIDYGVMPLEGLWWAKDMASFQAGRKAEWRWTLMIMQPEVVDLRTVEAAIEQLRRKKPLPDLNRLRFEVLDEGLCAQTMHIGPFAEEGPTVARVHAFIDACGVRRGRHHEIYLSDIRRADPRRWRTVIRQPMTEAAVR